MNRKTFSEKIMAQLEEKKIPNRANFTVKVFANPEDETDGELRLNGAQMTAVLSAIADIKYKFYQVNEDILKNGGREKIIKNLKSQYPGIIFFICGDGSTDNEPKTIDTENNLIVVDNDDFDAAVELCGGASNYLETMME